MYTYFYGKFTKVFIDSASLTNIMDDVYGWFYYRAKSFFPRLIRSLFLELIYKN